MRRTISATRSRSISGSRGTPHPTSKPTLQSRGAYRKRPRATPGFPQGHTRGEESAHDRDATAGRPRVLVVSITSLVIVLAVIDRLGRWIGRLRAAPQARMMPPRVAPHARPGDERGLPRTPGRVRPVGPPESP
jgi:hypothetical protein